MIGEFAVNMQYEDRQKNLELTVVAGDGPCLLGWNWLEEIKLNWTEIKAISTHTTVSLQYLLHKYSEIFTRKLEAIKSFKAKLNVKVEA